ncbi:MAG: cation:proton antiporter [Myxococcota bacterium]|nr:cation:proton antiporter [Myxococcota bacterium]
MAGGGGHSVDFVRKGMIVGALFGAMFLMYRYAVPSESPDPTGLLALGFVVLAAFLIGELVEVIKLPHITGYLLAGLALGPSVAHTFHGALPPPFDVGILNENVIGQLGILNDLALPLICLTAGGALDVPSIRKAIKPILGLLTGQTILMFVGCIGLVYLISGPLPFLKMDALADLPMSGILAIGAVVGSISLATSDAATIAIIVSTRAKGPLSTNALSVAVLKDILVVIFFSASTAFAVGALGTGEAASFADSMIGIGLSVVMGLGLGWGIHLYLKYINAEVLLFLVAMIYTMTFVADSLGAESALMFIAAGFIAANYSEHGDRLISEVERLSMPVFVVFFTLAGAKLHLDVLVSMAGFALALVAVRTAAFYVGCRVGGVLTGADPASVKYGWMTFVSQAGLAITLADTMPGTYGPEIGGALFSFLLAGVAVHELIGPAMLQFALDKAGEIPHGEPDEAAADEPASTPAGPAPTWQPMEAIDDPWGAPLNIGSPALQREAESLEVSLHSMVESVIRGELVPHRASAEQHLRDLQQVFLREHRQIIVASQTIETDKAVRQGLSRLAQQWRALVAARSQGFSSRAWVPMSLVAQLDARAEDCPELISAPLEPETLTPREESRIMASRRTALRGVHRVRSVERAVNLRALFRYHLSGLAPQRLEAVSAAVGHGELVLAEEIGALYDEISAALISAAAHSEHPQAALWALRGTVRTAFQRIDSALGERYEGGRVAIIEALGGGMRAIKADLPIIGTLDLPARHRRFGRVFRERNQGIQTLTEGVGAASDALVARYNTLELMLEVAALNASALDAAEQYGQQLSARITADGIQPVQRTINGLSQALEGGEALLKAGLPGTELVGKLREAATPLLSRIAEEAELTAVLRAELLSPTASSDLLDALLKTSQQLSPSYIVPVGELISEDGHLFSAEVIEVPLQKLIVSAIETAVSRRLTEASRMLAEQLEESDRQLAELQRVIPFNVELACSELEVYDGPVPEEGLELVREMLLGAIRRNHDRMTRLLEELSPLAVASAEAIPAAVVEELEILGQKLRDGDHNELRRLSLTDEDVGRRFVERAEEWGGLLSQAGHQLEAAFLIALGEDRLEDLRIFLGLPGGRELHLKEALTPPAVDHAPTVYQRLFTDGELDAGDVLIGREALIVRAAQALNGAPGQLRTVAILGQRGAGLRAVALAAVRGMPSLRRRTLNKPPTVEDIAQWFPVEPGSVVLIEGLHWMLSPLPGGAAPLRRFIQGVLDDAGQSAWLLVAEESVWDSAGLRSPLSAAFSEEIIVPPMAPAQLQAAMLTRHAMSGYTLRFEASEDLGWQLRYLLRRTNDARRRTQEAWFDTLHMACGGQPLEALPLWLASIQRVDEAAGVIRMGPVPRPARGRLSRLSEDDLLLLRAALRQGWLDIDCCASLFRIDEQTARARLAGLAGMGLLEGEGGCYSITAHLHGPLCAVLSERRWL